MASGAVESLAGREALAAGMLSLASSAQFDIRLASFALEGRLYGGEAFVEAIKNFLLSSERARLRVLLNQPRDAVQHAPRLIELGRRMSSRVEFRQLAEPDLAQTGERMIVDQASLLLRPTPESLGSRLISGDAVQIRNHIGAFDSQWERADGAMELRALSL